MPTIFESKEQAVTETPLLIFDCVLADGQTERWSTHAVKLDGLAYEARVLQHNVFEMQTAAEQGVDGIPRISLLLGNADSHFSEIERSTGWKGARLTATFLFYDLPNDTPATEKSVIFQGICNPPDEIREATFRITANNRMNLQRLLLPQVRIQRRCPWEFPATESQRIEALDGGERGKYSRFYRCGYSAGVPSGVGNLNAGAPFTACGFTRTDCEARGMSTHFGGIGFVPAAISVRTFGDKSPHTSAVSVNQARYNDFVPLVYGTAWYTPPIVFARNDGNLTRMEVLLGLGEMQGVLKVLVNDVEIPLGVSGTNMTGTGWYNMISPGAREGAVDPYFPGSDPYGSMAYLTVAVPNRLNDGTSLPRVKVLAQGLKVPVYDTDGAYAGEQFSSNPAWILLDMLQRTGWRSEEIDLPSFAHAAAYCEETINAVDIYGSAIGLARFQCNLALQTRRSAGDLIRGVRNCARLLLSYRAGGTLEARVESAIVVEQPEKPAWSNSTEQLNGGWPSYEFGEAEILRKPSLEPSVRMYSRSTADTPNRFSVEFQDSLNEYQHDSFSLVDPSDVSRGGQEIAATLNAVGLPHFDQAARILKVNLDKSVRGNTYIEFDSSVKSFGVRPGDLITVTYLKEGLLRQPFRVLKIAPGLNHRVTTITAQIHDDAWYADTNGQANSGSGGGRQAGAGIGMPRPLIGTELDEHGDIQFGVEEAATANSDAQGEISVNVSFFPPAVTVETGPRIPLVSLSASVGEGGTIEGGQTLYYAVSGTDSDGNESGLSFLVRAVIVSSESTVTLHGLSFAPGTTAFRVYRGSTPAQLFRIASDLAPAAEFTDTGFAKELVAPPDANFDHANFYWRMEMQPEFAATIHSPTTIGNEALAMAVNRYRGMIARIDRGKGAGQERAITSNTTTTLTVAPAWHVEPDATSFFVVAENGWKFGAQSTSSPVQFAVADRAGETVQISGRAANAYDVESSPEISTVTRWQIGGVADTGAPPIPSFGLAAGPKGSIELSAVSFADLANTHSITSATLTLHYWKELAGAPAISLAAAMSETDTLLDLNIAGTAVAGTLIQIGAELMRVDDVLQDGTRYAVTRSINGSGAVAHAAADPVFTLTDKTIVTAFPAEFFGSPYSGSWTDSIPLPDVRVEAAELFVTNSKGNSESSGIYLTHNEDFGLRTLSGGQYSIQVSGHLAMDASAAPPLMVEAPHAVRDVYAVLGSGADGEIEVRLNVDDAPYCTLRIAAGLTVSDSVDGNALPPLLTGAKVTLSVLSVGQVAPGADLTVLIRL
jgi:hypothetical protein